MPRTLRRIGRRQRYSGEWRPRIAERPNSHDKRLSVPCELHPNIKLDMRGPACRWTGASDRSTRTQNRWNGRAARSADY
ncbi:MAG TPA: hypothetical protein VE441_09505 [Mycobacterium sp.]|nr:hypothetical protein [Mycobacterium sp.]